MFDVQFDPSSLGRRRRLPFGAALLQRGIVHFQPKGTAWNVETDHIPVPNESQRSTGCRLRTNVKYHGPIGRAAHASVGYSHHIRDPLAENFGWQGHVAHL